ncbi:MAG: hypothetical protein WCF94_03145 [bacterium]
MFGVEKSHYNAVVGIVVQAYFDCRNGTAADALSSVIYGKGDTLKIDEGPEVTICTALQRYDGDAYVVTEEIGKLHHKQVGRPGDPDLFRTLYICDPIDRSTPLKRFLQTFDKNKTVKEILSQEGSIGIWESMNGAPATITGACSAVTCVRRGKPIFTVVVNYITRQLITASAAGIKILNLPEDRPDRPIDIEHVCNHGKSIHFPVIDGDDDSRRFVTFMGDEGKTGYAENFRDSGIMTEAEAKKYIHYNNPGGPLRILYLSNLQPKEVPVGFILANGEKIGEWIHWIPFICFAKSTHDESCLALRMQEVSQKRPWTKEGVLMSTPPNYSVFQELCGNTCIDVGTLMTMPNPSKVRGTLIVSSDENRWVIRVSSASDYRQIKF